MTDLEITRLCAIAMGLDKFQWQTGGIVTGSNQPILAPGGRIDYDPLNDDAQTMALMKRFSIGCDRDGNGPWTVVIRNGRNLFVSEDPILNRAICGVVAEMEREKRR